MNCKKCNTPLPEGSKFCYHCGNPVTEDDGKRFCSVCGAELDGSLDLLFCPSCGVKLNNPATINPQTNPQTNIRDNPIPQQPAANETYSNAYPFASIFVSMYNGTPTVGISPATGRLSVYSDRIEFKKQFGSSISPILGSIGVRRDPLDIYPLGQIASVSVGRYAAIYKTLVLCLKDNRIVSFCPAMPNSSEPQRIVNFLQGRIG